MGLAQKKSERVQPAPKGRARKKATPVFDFKGAAEARAMRLGGTLGLELLENLAPWWTDKSLANYERFARFLAAGPKTPGAVPNPEWTPTWCIALLKDATAEAKKLFGAPVAAIYKESLAVLQRADAEAKRIASAPDLEPAPAAEVSVFRMPDPKEVEKAKGETTKKAVNPKREGLKAIGTWVKPEDALGLTAIAAAKEMGVTDYLAQVVAQHVARNPRLVEEGKKKLDQPRRYRTRRMELEERVRELEKQAKRAKPAPR